jgi:DNA-binding NarL/FixJ family response regulator
MSYTTIRIIIADDHELFRDGFKSMIKTCPGIELVDEAANGEQLVDQVRKHLPDVVLTDIKMPLLAGAEVTRIINHSYPSVRVIALSTFDNDRLIIDMLTAGAKGYLSKNARKEEIIEAIEAVNRNQQYFCKTASAKLNLLITLKGFNPRFCRQQEILTEKEKEVMILMCEELSLKEISAKVNLSVRTIEGYKERIQEKIGARNIAGIILYAVRNEIYVP